MNVETNRTLKVYESGGYNYKPTPTIILKGQWLQKFGFTAGDNLNVSCEDGRLIITRATNDSNSGMNARGK